jgi:hypothetical protein
VERRRQVTQMSDMHGDDTTPTLEVRILRDGAVVQRELCETEAEANALVEAWSDVDGVVVEVDDLARDTGGAGVLDPRPWEVDADDLAYEGAAPTDEEEER